MKDDERRERILMQSNERNEDKVYESDWNVEDIYKVMVSYHDVFLLTEALELEDASWIEF